MFFLSWVLHVWPGSRSRRRLLNSTRLILKSECQLRLTVKCGSLCTFVRGPSRLLALVRRRRWRDSSDAWRWAPAQGECRKWLRQMKKTPFWKQDRLWRKDTSDEIGCLDILFFGRRGSITTKVQRFVMSRHTFLFFGLRFSTALTDVSFSAVHVLIFQAYEADLLKPLGIVMIFGAAVQEGTRQLRCFRV